MFQIEGNVAGGMKTLLGIFLQAVLHDALQRGRNIAIGFAQIRRIFFRMALIVSAAVSRWKARLPEIIS